MFPAVAQARRRNIRTPERRVSDMQRRSPSDGILRHSLSPRKSPSAELSSDAVTVGSSWMLRRASGAESSEHPRACALPQGSVSLPLAVTNGGLSPSRHGQGHYGFNATAHTNDRAVALACDSASRLPCAASRPHCSRTRTQVPHPIAPLLEERQAGALVACPSSRAAQHAIAPAAAPRARARAVRPQRRAASVHRGESWRHCAEVLERDEATGVSGCGGDAAASRGATATATRSAVSQPRASSACALVVSGRRRAENHSARHPVRQHN